MELIHVKLNSGEDILGYGFVDADSKVVRIEHPICVKVDPSLGIYAVKWLHFSEKNSHDIPTFKVMSVDKASKVGIDCYEDFMYRHGKSGDEGMMTSEELSESVNELEDLFTTMIEAKVSTKH